MEHSKDHTKQMNSYTRLLIMTILSFASMFILMYSMVDSLSNIMLNINQIYMAGLMTAPMVLIELMLMGQMYPNKKMNMIVISVAVIALASFFFSIRQQTGVGDKQFLRSMIPHHGAAVLMVQKTPITDPEIKKLANGIIETQMIEINQMKAKLKELEK